MEVQDFRKHHDKTLFYGDKEASGRVIVGLFMIKIMMVLEEKYPNIQLVVDHEIRVLEANTFACDDAILASALASSTSIVCVYVI